MMKNISMAALLFGVSQVAISNEVVMTPYFTDVDGWSTRFGITNPSEEKVETTIRFYDVDGNQVGIKHFVLGPKTELVGLVSKTEYDSSMVYFPENGNICSNNEPTLFYAREGYITVSSEDFPTAGPEGFCGNDYVVDGVDKLKLEYSLWDNTSTQRFDSRTSPLVSNPAYTSWTKLNGASTSWVITLDSFNGTCQNYDYLVSDREGNVWQSYDVVSPGPAGYNGVSLCHKVNVVSFGSPVLPSKVGIDGGALTGATEMNAGWMQILTPAYGLSIRSPN